MKVSKTHSPKKENIKPDWHLIDANGQILGKVATQISTLLIGKNKPNFASHINVGDKVVVINAEKVEVTGNKLKTKTYYRHTGYPGSVKAETLEQLLNRRPTEVVKRAVAGMLPQNKLKKERLSNLYIYKGNEHPHSAQLK